MKKCGCLAVFYPRIGPYHYARLRAAGKLGKLVAVEMSSQDNTYAWEQISGSDSFFRVSLFQNADFYRKPARTILRQIDSVLSDERPDAVAVPGWFGRRQSCILGWCIQTRTPCIVMWESSLLDGPRKWWREILKRRVVQLYTTGLAAGKPQLDYLASISTVLQ